VKEIIKKNKLKAKAKKEKAEAKEEIKEIKKKIPSAKKTKKKVDSLVKNAFSKKRVIDKPGAKKAKAKIKAPSTKPVKALKKQLK
jgi:hypothetical protein